MPDSCRFSTFKMEITTSRNVKEQNWVVINLDKKECFELGRLGHSIFRVDLHGLLVRKYTLPTADQYSDSQTQSAFLSHLPDEMIAEIFVQVEDIEDTAALALTCQICWDMCARVVKRLPMFAPWLGDRLLVIGESTRFTDLPPNVLTNEEKKLIRDYIYSRCCLYHSIALGDCLPTFRMLNFRTQLQEQPSPHLATWGAALREETSLGNLRRDDLVLRNLSTREYVRGDAFAKLIKDAPYHWRMYRWRLGDILMLRICWATSTSTRLVHENGITRGGWAGGRFDVAKKDSVLRDVDEWKDVSKELLDDVKTLFMMGCSDTPESESQSSW
ncbi:hypothetical protein EXIGLDRAFT_807279 [Exidia glandulosa HHB12029]|uniref:F-box domain-containing protein n=1 Tax=Exidia glandulosa HHB12029 TaxID=1314781 RepID=A0A165DBV4_EXIGL|nr:hypothetical protein EXIGLDRAFT_807279 [Exidia glandulosa HHB12029]